MGVGRLREKVFGFLGLANHVATVGLARILVFLMREVLSFYLGWLFFGFVLFPALGSWIGGDQEFRYKTLTLISLFVELGVGYFVWLDWKLKKKFFWKVVLLILAFFSLWLMVKPFSTLGVEFCYLSFLLLLLVLTRVIESVCSEILKK